MSNISLYCLPYSGGSAAMYYKWRSVLSDNITLRPLEPAGRGTRIRQPLCLTMVDAVADLYQQFVKHYTGGDYAIFGHSHDKKWKKQEKMGGFYGENGGNQGQVWALVTKSPHL